MERKNNALLDAASRKCRKFIVTLFVKFSAWKHEKRWLKQAAHLFVVSVGEQFGNIDEISANL